LYIIASGDGNYYYSFGAVFKLDTSGNLGLLYQFPSSLVSTGALVAVPVTMGPANPILDSAGNLYGATHSGGTAGIIYEIEAGGNVRTLHNFEPAHGGSTPYSGLTLDSAGNLYGTTQQGGAANAGVVYKLSESGHETVLYEFKGGPKDGAAPQTGVVMDKAGNIYGATPVAGGGAWPATLYKVSPQGQETILYTFPFDTESSGLAIDSAGNLYGTTISVSVGEVFKVDPAGNYSVVYTFSGGTDGGGSNGGVILDSAGNLYGTVGGGTLGFGVGVIFKIDTSGTYSVLYTLTPATDGSFPGTLVLDAVGNLYGTCSADGPQGGGTLFKLDTAGNFTVLYAFAGGPTVGQPSSGVALDAAGNLYGTVSAVGESLSCPGTAGACGTVYELDTSGKFTVLYTFTAGAGGTGPEGPVTLDSVGHLYGVASDVLSVPGVAGAVLQFIGGGLAYKITLAN
jgi:uncharacterized repeat protein (TIGR03803 family)